MTTLAGRLGLGLPIIQSPMAGSQASALAIAVASAGALGSLPCATLSLEAMRDELSRLAGAVRGAYNVNFLCHATPPVDEAVEARWRRALDPYYREAGIDPATIPAGPGRAAFDHAAADVLEPFRPPVVSFHFGLPAPALLTRVKQWGSLVLASATTVDEARWLASRGVDAVIAQGVEAGGHRGLFLHEDVATQVGTFALVPQIVAAVGVPVIAAGGIADATGVAAALRLGASAVQVGTTYLLCPEATVSAVHRQALAEPWVPTALTNLFTGRPARGIVNRLMRDLGPMSATPPPFPLAGAALAPLRAAAEREGRGDFSPLWSGQNRTGCRAVPAADLTRSLAAEL